MRALRIYFGAVTYDDKNTVQPSKVTFLVRALRKDFVTVALEGKNTVQVQEGTFSVRAPNFDICAPHFLARYGARRKKKPCLCFLLED